MSAAERAAVPGELCTCGRQAVTVFLAESGAVGYCGRPDGGARTVPCPWCGDGPHLTGYGDPRRCPDYTLRAPAPARTDGAETEPDEINRSREGDGTAECLGCGHEFEFELDSSPEPEHCWSCADWLSWLAGRGVS